MSQEELDKLSNRFSDHQKKENESYFEFHKRSVIQQKKMREVVEGFIFETNE